MKFAIILTLVFSATFAQASDVLLTCTKTNFSDLDKIVITSSETNSNEMIITETSENGTNVSYTAQLSEIENAEIELSNWFGYTRLLYNDGQGWNIEHHDECGGGVSSVTCF